MRIGELGVPTRFTEAARFQSWLDDTWHTPRHQSLWLRSYGGAIKLSIGVEV